MNQKLAKKIEAYLATRVKSQNGDWAEVTDKDLNTLYEIISGLIHAKYAPDADGDIPIEFRLIDRTKTRRLNYRPVPYDLPGRGELTPEQEAEVMEVLLFNLGIATQDVNNRLHIARFHRNARKLKEETSFKESTT